MARELHTSTLLPLDAVSFISSFHYSLFLFEAVKKKKKRFFSLKLIFLVLCNLLCVFKLFSFIQQWKEIAEVVFISHAHSHVYAFNRTMVVLFLFLPLLPIYIYIVYMHWYDWTGGTCTRMLRKTCEIPVKRQATT